MRKNYSYGSMASYIDIGELTMPADWAVAFGRKAPLEVEIGFGTGEYLVGLAEKDPSKNFLGLEQSAERIVKTLRKIHELRLTNIRLIQIDAAWAFHYFLSPKSADRIHCLFPCPWPKKRHTKHRLFSTDFLKVINSRLVAGGGMRLVTDHRPYADWIEEGAAETGFHIERKTIPPSFGTKFEKKWLSAGQQTFDELIFSKDFHIDVGNNEGGEMRVYFLEKIDSARVEFPKLSGAISVQFTEFVFDAGRDRGMVQAVVTEDRRTQYLWISISRAQKRWRVGPAAGALVLPTPGIQKALELAYDAFLKSGSKS